MPGSADRRKEMAAEGHHHRQLWLLLGRLHLSPECGHAVVDVNSVLGPNGHAERGILREVFAPSVLFRALKGCGAAKYTAAPTMEESR